MRRLVWGLVILLAILHYDFWYWEDEHLVLGFMPVGLAYHAGLSLVAALAWALVIHHAWPDEVEEWAAEGGEPIRTVDRD